jgi:hypothetical protein
MKLKLALLTAAAIGAAALTSGTAAAMPIANLNAHQSANVEQVRWVCGPFRCWWRPNFYGAYDFYGPPRFYHHPWGWRRWHYWRYW